MGVGLTVGGWFASAIISKLINEFIDYGKDQKNKLGLEDEVARLEKALPMIQAVLNDADRRLIREVNEPLEKWLWQLRDAVDKTNDVMDEMRYKYEKERVEAEKNKVNKVITNFKTFFLRDPLLESLKEAVKAIDGVAANVGQFYTLVKDLVQTEMINLDNNREFGSVFNVGTHVFGREIEKEDIIKKLLSGLSHDCKTEKKNLTVLPIIGVGGVGKTTLVKYVYNDSTVEEHFKLRMWVCISNNFDAVLLTKKLYESAFDESPNLLNFDVIQKKLENKLQSVRFLVVFDDVWYDKKQKGWNNLIAPLTHGQSGSMMLLTTRIKSIPTLTGTNLMDSIVLEGLNECSMWDLFKESALGGEHPDNYEQLEKIGRDIVKKVKGSPLVAKTIGGILCSNLNEEYWKTILESELWSLEQGQNDTMSILRLTYQYLPGNLKPCFSLCSIFPQDHVFRKDYLINMWIALDMVPQNVNGIMMRPEDVGSKYFADMLIRSIFIPDPKYPNNENFVMHDLIHDLSVFVSQGEFLRTNTIKLVSVPNTVRHLYVDVDGPRDLIPDLSDLKNLHSFILHFDESRHDFNQDSLVNEMLEGMKSLRLLILFAHNLSEISENVGNLLHLRYLSVSSSTISAFPESVSKLYLLETMVYNGSSQLRQADVLGKLINLKELTIKTNGGFNPPICFETQSLLKLVHLTIVGFNFEHLPCLELLPLLKKIDFRDMNRIESIIHEFNQSPAIDAFPSLEGLSFHCMREIKLWDLSKEPNKWMQCLRKLDVSDCQKLQVLPPVPVGVKELIFHNLALYTLPSLCNDQSSKSRSDLVRMRISNCKKLKSLSEGLLQNPKRFVALKELTISGCDIMVNLPPGGFKYFISLKELCISRCSWIKVEEECFLPSALQKLEIYMCGSLGATSSKALESVHALVVLGLDRSAQITNLPPKEVFSRWKTLKRLTITNCIELASLESLLGLSSIEYLRVYGCCKLSPAIPSSSSTMETGETSTKEKPLLSGDELVIGETDRKEKDTMQMQTSSRNDEFNKWFWGGSRRALTFFHNLLCTLLYVLKMFIPKLKRSVSAQPQPQPLFVDELVIDDPLLLYVDELVIDDPLLLSVEPMRSLSAVRKLTIENCSKLMSLPKLPPLVQELCIRQCSPELLKRCEESGLDWPKLSQILKLELHASNTVGFAVTNA